MSNGAPIVITLPHKYKILLAMRGRRSMPRGVKKNGEFANDRHTILNFAHQFDTSIHCLVGQIVLILSICVCIFILRSLFFFAPLACIPGSRIRFMIS